MKTTIIAIMLAMFAISACDRAQTFKEDCENHEGVYAPGQCTMPGGKVLLEAGRTYPSDSTTANE